MRINLFGGPSSGKSTTASWLFSNLKREGYNIELIPEYIKKWTYINHNISPGSFEQFYIFGKQLYNEDVVLRSGFEHLIADCPLYAMAFYAEYYDMPGSKQIIEISKKFEDKYNSYNIFLLRDDSASFSEIGRFHDYKEACKIDKKLKTFLKYQNIDHVVFGVEEQDDILSSVKEQINENNK